MKPVYKYNWFWFVLLPSLLIGVVFLVALLFHSLQT
jgi:hypothetical protein